ncbi:peroxidase 29-like [Papaver somniferum]|nr:peroxidase 29-like [Papaver somniferum]
MRTKMEPVILACTRIWLIIISCLVIISIVGDVGVMSSSSTVAGLLSYQYYETSCPQVESIVTDKLTPILLSDPASSAALLRLLFHDCQVQGCDASLLLDSDTSEMSSSKNFAIRNRETIGIIKTAVDSVCPGTVSCSDILVLAARDAVAMSGGPKMKVLLGRKDSNTSNHTLADASLPAANTGVGEMLSIFTKRGMTVEESVAILGSHTLGVSHCVNIMDRFSRQIIGANRTPFETLLALRCAFGASISNSGTVGNDVTITKFDNQYYKDTSRGRGLLKIDSDMSTDPRTAPIVERFAQNQNEFFKEFTAAFLKLTSANVLTGHQGVVRTKCNAVN